MKNKGLSLKSVPVSPYSLSKAKISETPLKTQKSLSNLNHISTPKTTVYSTLKHQTTKAIPTLKSQSSKESLLFVTPIKKRSTNVVETENNSKLDCMISMMKNISDFTPDTGNVSEILEIKESVAPILSIVDNSLLQRRQEEIVKEDPIGASEAVQEEPTEIITQVENIQVDKNAFDAFQPSQEQENSDLDDEPSPIPLKVEATKTFLVEKKFEKNKNEPELSKEGYLMKKTSIFFGWERAYFKVEALKIYLAQSKELFEMKTNIKCLNLLANPCEITEHKGQELSILIKDTATVLILKADSVQEANDWASFFKKVFDFARQKLRNGKTYIPRLEIFNKADVVLEEEFLADVDTGDILLLRSEHFTAKMQRMFTVSEYDHLALILRAKNDVFLFDSNIENGVQLTSWTDFKKENQYLNYSTMAYRKLRIPDEKIKNIINDKLWEFVTLHVGKKYELNIRKLFRRPSFSEPEQEQGRGSVDLNTTLGDICAPQEDILKNSLSLNTFKSPTSITSYRDTDEGFFCSELVAAAYKAAGLLSTTISSTRYLPVSFSQRKELMLFGGGSFSCEYGLSLINEP